jgi:serine/threonine protein kinase
MSEETLFHEALAKPPGERAVFLDAACAGRPELRAAVEALLAAHEASGNPLDRPPADIAQTLESKPNRASPDASSSPPGVTAAYPAHPAPGMVIAGRYKLVEEIGEGGMGTVYMAQQTEPVKRLVAVKIIKPGMDSKEILARFEAERQALALMDHPNIARVLDAGATESGRPFFVMELVKGTPITQYCDQRKLTPRERLELFLPVCQAIQHAHQKGIIHRDIKPSNVLVALYDDRPVPKVIDFGLAKATGQALTERTLITGFGALVGTPEYMSPEQANLNNLDIDTRCDIYTLGVLLYELLTGSTPVDRKSLANAAMLEVLRIVRDVEAPRASTKLSSSANLPSIAANRGTEPAKLTRLLRGELDWVLLKALEKDRGRRYETANGLARDIQRYLADEIVEARPPSTSYRLRKFARRHKPQVIAAGLLFLTLVAGVAGTTFGLLRAQKAQVRAEAGEKLAGDRLGQVEAEKKNAEAEKKNAQTEQQKAEQEKQIALAVQAFLENGLLRQADVSWQASSLIGAGRNAAEANQNVTIRELLDRVAADLAPERIDTFFPNQPRVQAAILRTVGNAYHGVGEYQRAIAFLKRSLALSRREFGGEHAETLSSTSDLGLAYKYAGKLDLALPLLEEAFRLRKAKLGPEKRETLISMNSLATAYHAAGKLDLAIPLYEETLNLRKAKFGPKDPDTLTSMGNLAFAYQDAGKLDRALPLYEETLKLKKSKLGSEHPNTLVSMNNLAVGYRLAGRLDLALPLSQETLKLSKAMRGPEHPDTLTAMNNLAQAYQAAGKLDLAVPLYEETVKLWKAKYGADHPNTETAMNNLAYAFLVTGKLDLALPLYKQTLELRKAELGPEHPDTLSSMNNLAVAYQDAGKLVLALPLYEEALKLRKAKLGPKHPDTQRSMNNLAMAYRDAGKLDLALPLFEETLKLSKAKLGPEHPDTLVTMNGLARASLDAGKLDLALPLFEETLKLRKGKLGPEHPDTLRSMNYLATAYQAAGKLDLALPLFEETLKLRKAKLGPEHPDTLTSMCDLAAAYVAAGKLDMSVPLFEESLTLRKAKLGPEHPDTLVSMNGLARAYLATRKPALALPLFEETLKLRKVKLGPDHPDTLVSMSNLAVSYRAAGKPDLALPLLEETLKLMRAKFGPEHPATLAMMNYLASAYRAAGKLDLALLLYKESLKLTKAKLGPEHPDTLYAMTSLAAAYGLAGKADLAVPLLEETLRLTKAKLGPEHPETLHKMNDLALTYHAAGRLDLALPLFEETLRLRQLKLGRQHPDTLWTVASLGSAYQRADRLAEALPLLEEAYLASKKDPRLRWVGEPLLMCYARTGECEKAARLTNELLVIVRKQLPKDSPLLAARLGSAGFLLLQMKAFTEAEPILREAMLVGDKAQPDHVSTYLSKSLLGGALSGQKKYVEAEPLLLAGYQGMKEREAKIPPGEKVRLTEALERLVQLYDASGKKEEAAKWRKELQSLKDAAARGKNSTPHAQKRDSSAEK